MLGLEFVTAIGCVEFRPLNFEHLGEWMKPGFERLKTDREI